jgi:universal stress protein A
MTAYRRILAAIDLTEDSRTVARKASELAQYWNGSLQLLHVVEFVPIEPMSDSLVPVVQIDDQMLARARNEIEALGRELQLTASACHIETGSAKTEILRYAREQHADLIVLGSRERHGLSVLVNLTEDTVLHAAPCDVLAVRVR